MTISFIISVKKYYLFQKYLTSISFIVSYLPIPPSSLGTSGPEHSPSQENDVHHKIKDEQQNTEQIQRIYQWMHTGKKEKKFTSTISFLDQPSTPVQHLDQHLLTISIDTQPVVSWQSINVLIDPQLTAGRYSVKCWQTHLLQVLIDTRVMSAKISRLSSVNQVSTVCQPFKGINWGINYWLSFNHRSLNCTWFNVSLKPLVPGSRFFLLVLRNHLTLQNSLFISLWNVHAHQWRPSCACMEVELQYQAYIIW